jgi:hypothetical protein
LNKLIRFAEKLGMDVASLILLLVISFAVLAFLANKFNGNVIGNTASWLESHAAPQG